MLQVLKLKHRTSMLMTQIISLKFKKTTELTKKEQQDKTFIFVFKLMKTVITKFGLKLPTCPNRGIFLEFHVRYFQAILAMAIF